MAKIDQLERQRAVLARDLQGIAAARDMLADLGDTALIVRRNGQRKVLRPRPGERAIGRARRRDDDPRPTKG